MWCALFALFALAGRRSRDGLAGPYPGAARSAQRGYTANGRTGRANWPTAIGCAGIEEVRRGINRGSLAREALAGRIRDGSLQGVDRPNPFPARNPLMSRPIDSLHGDPVFRELASRLASMVELQAMVSAAYPHAPLTVLSLSDDGTLALAARNAAEAARLRQIEPSLVDSLRRRGAAVSRLRVRTRRTAAESARLPPPTLRSPIPDSALAEFAKLGDTSASDGLKRALETLVRRQRAERGR